MKRLFSIDHIFITALSFLMSGLFAGITASISFLNPVAMGMSNFSAENLFYSILAQDEDRSESSLISVVDIFDLEDRARFAELIDSLELLHPGVVAFDIYCDGMKGDTLGSMRMAESVARADDNLVFGTWLTNLNMQTRQYEHARHPFFVELLDEGSIGHTNVPEDRGGRNVNTLVFDQYYNDTRYSALSIQTLRKYAPEVAARYTGEELKIDFPPVDFHRIPFNRLAEHKDYITDHIVLVGDCKAENDLIYTPAGKIPGVEFHAYAIHTMLNTHETHQAPLWASMLVSIFFVWLTSVLYGEFRAFTLRNFDNVMVYFFSTSLLITWMFFLWVALITYLAFMAFVWFDYSMNMSYMLMGVASISINANFYAAVATLLYNRYHVRWLKPSPFVRVINKAPKTPAAAEEPVLPAATSSTPDARKKRRHNKNRHK